MFDVLLLLDSTFYNAIGLSFVTFGVLVTIRFLGYPDLTPDGSFTLGACVFARLISDGQAELVALGCALCAGMLCGTLTTTLNHTLQIGKLLSSVIVMILAVASAPYVLGRATIGLLHQPLLLGRLSSLDAVVTRSVLGPQLGFVIHPVSTALALLLLSGLGIALYMAARTRWGVGVRYLGSSFNSEPIIGTVAGRYKYLALVLGNGLVAFGGVVSAETRGGADQGMGLGIVLSGVAALIIGESLIRWRRHVSVLTPAQEVLAALVGTLLFSLIVMIVLFFAGTHLDVRLLTAMMLVLVLAISHRKEGRRSELF